MKKYFKENSTVLFQGDSVTDWHRERNTECKTLAALGEGYPKKFKEIYDILFPFNTVNFVNRGVSGDRIANLLERYDEDFVAVKPDFISIMIGINDTWHGFNEGEQTTVEAFARDYELLLQKLKKDLPDAKIMIIEQFMLEDHEERKAWKADVAAKRAVTKALADKYADYFIPMYDIINNAAKGEYTPSELSDDGVHPAEQGFSLITTEIMKTLGII